MSNTNQAADPSMEEILASIRRIISDDDPPEETAAAGAASEPVAVPDPEPEEEMDDANSDIDAMLADMEAESKADDNVTAIMPEFDSAPAADDDDIFDLTDIVEDEEADSSSDASKASGKPLVGVEDQDLCFDDAPAVKSEPEPAPVAAEPAVHQKDALLSPDAAADASAAFGVLANTILTSSGNSRTLEDLVQDLLRPMLKSWLDENLPPLVERLVREEIERVARQGR